MGNPKAVFSRDTPADPSGYRRMNKIQGMAAHSQGPQN